MNRAAAVPHDGFSQSSGSTLMAQFHTHYDNLKVARNAPPEVIRAAYKTLSQKYHPDRNPDSAEAIRIIQIINAAYEVLSDPVKRQEHDDWIMRMEAGGREASPKPARNAAGEPGRRHVSRHGRRTKRSGMMQKLRRKTASGTAGLLHKVRTLIDRFSRRIASKG